jgi:hypothetical protein
MRQKSFTYVLFSFIIALMAVTTSCQKDPDLKDDNVVKNGLKADSTKVGAVISSPGNYLSASGTLKIKIKDSTYTFDASRDSIAFISVRVDDNKHYFGITAINKEHTMSFGISSSGFANSNTTNGIAGSQFLINQSGNMSGQQYSLSQFSEKKDFGNISIEQYNQGVVLAKGTFVTYLTTDDKATTPFYKVEGSFDLHLK